MAVVIERFATAWKSQGTRNAPYYYVSILIGLPTYYGRTDVDFYWEMKFA